MPNKLTIRIDVIPTDDPAVPQTVSKIVIEENDQVTFDNATAKKAVVTFPGTGPLCQGGQSKNPILIDPNTDQKLKVCVTGGEYKYTAKVDDALEEDPILIVERSLAGPGLNKKPIFFPEGIPMLVIGALVGALVGYLIAKRLLRRNPRQT